MVTTSPEGHQRSVRLLQEGEVLRKSNAAGPGADQALGEEEEGGVGWPLVPLGFSKGVASVMLENDAVGEAVELRWFVCARRRYTIYRRVEVYERLFILSSRAM